MFPVQARILFATISGSNCYSVSAPVTISKSASMTREMESVSNFSETTVYPNPARDKLNLKYSTMESQELIVVLTDLTGREMLRRSMQSQEGENKVELLVYDFPRGIYFLNLISEEERQTIKVVLQ